MMDPLLFDYGITVELIQKKVSLITTVPVAMLTAPNGTDRIRKRELVQARQISMKLAKEYTNDSLALIGEKHGGRDHATVLHANKTIDNLLDTNVQEVVMAYSRVRKILENHKLVVRAMFSPQEDTIFNTEK